MRNIINGPRYSTMAYTLAGHDVTLIFTVSHQKRENWAHVVIDNKPVATLSFFHEQVYMDSLEAAETAVLSYMENKGKWSMYPNTFYNSMFRHNDTADIAPKGYYSSMLAQHKFDLALMDTPGTTVDTWVFFGTRYLFVEIPVRENNEVVDAMKFSIWDNALQRQTESRLATLREQRKALAH